MINDRNGLDPYSEDTELLNSEYKPDKESAELPESVDWRDKQVVTQVKDQVQPYLYILPMAINIVGRQLSERFSFSNIWGLRKQSIVITTKKYSSNSLQIFTVNFN